jgi:hypothetical protein
MACGTFTISKVPASKVQQTIDLFNGSKPSPTSAASAPDGNGLYKVTAIFPRCPDSSGQAGAQMP